MTKPDRAQLDAVIALLAEVYPKTFSFIEAKRRPLKIGIRESLQAALDGALTEDEIDATLRHYTWSTGYLRNILTGAWRYDLDGNPAGAVTRAEEDLAKARLSGLEAARARRKARAEAAAIEAAKPKRLTLADLKAAAIARRAA